MFNVTHPALADARVRQALRFAIDRKAILEKVEHGHGYLDESLVGPLSPYAALIAPEPYDPKRAAALLEAAGWALGGDGVRAKNGTKLSLEIATITGTSERDEWCLLIQSGWNAVGVKTSIKHYPPSILFASYQEGGILDTGKFEVAILGQGYGLAGSLDPILTCNQIPPAGFNTVRFCDPELDRMMARSSEAYDPAEAKMLSAQIQRAAAADVPIVTLFIPQDNFVVNADLKGLGNVANLDSAYRWSI